MQKLYLNRAWFSSWTLVYVNALSRSCSHSMVRHQTAGGVYGTVIHECFIHNIHLRCKYHLSRNWPECVRVAKQSKPKSSHPQLQDGNSVGPAQREQGCMWVMTKWQNKHLHTGALNKKRLLHLGQRKRDKRLWKIHGMGFWQLFMVIRFVQDVSKIQLSPTLFAYISQMYM